MKKSESRKDIHLRSVRRRFSPTATSRTIIESARRFPLVCTTVLAKNKAEFLKTTSKAASLGCDIAELRIDHLNQPDALLIKEIINSSPLPLIITNRSERDGGMFPVSKESLRLSLLEASLDVFPAFVDIELELPKQNRSALIKLARKRNVGVICSHHDFDSTPSTRQILKLAEKIQDTGADIAKLVFMPHHNSDSARILEASKVLGDEKRLFTVFGMGINGQMTRLANLIVGGCLIYCSLGKTDKNLGQISVGFARRYLDPLQARGWSKIRRARANLLSNFQQELKTNKKVSNSLDQILPHAGPKRLSKH
ncbi:MAG: type I 3-dehydroquinate dehydratase [Nitrososphaerales archaeon]